MAPVAVKDMCYFKWRRSLAEGGFYSMSFFISLLTVVRTNEQTVAF
jgi:hypothetical protein